MSTTSNRTIAVVDVGSTKVLALIGEASPEGGLVVLGAGLRESRGVRRGQVVHLDEASNAIREALTGAQASAGVKATQVIMSIDGEHIASQNSQGAVAIGREGHGVTHQDVRRSLEAAQAINLPNNREVLHVIPRRFRIDDQDGIRNPIGMLGFRLEVEAHVVTASTTATQNMMKCAHHAGVEVSEFVLASLASAEAVLTPDEREMGVALVDIGGGLTSIALFIEGTAWHVKSIEVGGNHFTSDLAQLLHLPIETATYLKETHGNAFPNDVPIDQMCDLIGFGSEGRVRVLRREVADILHARAEELFTLIEREILRSGYDGLLPAGLVITGGGALLPGLKQVARQVTQRPVRIAQPTGLRGFVDALQTPAGATAVGMLRWGLQDITTGSPRRRRSNALQRLSHWLRGFLPG